MSFPSQPIILCAKANSPSFSQNSPSLPQNSVSSVLRNSTLETVFRPFPSYTKELFLNYLCNHFGPHTKFL